MNEFGIRDIMYHLHICIEMCVVTKECSIYLYHNINPRRHCHPVQLSVLIVYYYIYDLLCM